MNIKQRRCLSEMTGSSSPSPFVLPYYLYVPLFSFALFTFSVCLYVQQDASLRGKIDAAEKHKYSSGLCICFDMLILWYKSIIFDEWHLFLLLLSLVCDVFWEHHQLFSSSSSKQCPVQYFPTGGRGCRHKGGKGSRFKYLIVNDKHHFITI